MELTKSARNVIILIYFLTFECLTRQTRDVP